MVNFDLVCSGILESYYFRAMSQLQSDQILTGITTCLHGIVKFDMLYLSLYKYKLVNLILDDNLTVF